MDDLFERPEDTLPRLTPLQYVILQEHLLNNRFHPAIDHVSIGESLTINTKMTKIDPASDDLIADCFVELASIVMTLRKIGLAAASIKDLHASIWNIKIRDAINPCKTSTIYLCIPMVEIQPFFTVDIVEYRQAIVDLQAEFYSGYEDLLRQCECFNTVNKPFLRRLSHITEKPTFLPKLPPPIPRVTSKIDWLKGMIQALDEDPRRFAASLMICKEYDTEHYRIASAIIAEIIDPPRDKVPAINKTQIDLSIKFGSWEMLSDDDLMIYYMLTLFYLSDSDSPEAMEAFNFIVRRDNEA